MPTNSSKPTASSATQKPPSRTPLLSDLEQAAHDLLERMDAQLKRIQAMRSTMSASAEQTEEETALFTEWLS